MTKEIKGERIAKRIAAAGICSRRDAERLIEEGCVKLNGEKVMTPATLVGPDDKITVKGKAISAPQAVRVFAFHKPVGLITTTKDEEGRPTVFDGLPAELPRLVSIGRLDINSEGILLLTTSGELARYLELPARGFARVYRVRVFGEVGAGKLDRLKNGITVEGVRYGPILAEIERSGSKNAWLRVTIHEGKNREIRRVMEHIGLQVNRLVRVAYGPFELGSIPRGAIMEIPLTFVKQRLPGFFAEKK